MSPSQIFWKTISAAWVLTILAVVIIFTDHEIWIIMGAIIGLGLVVLVTLLAVDKLFFD